MPYTFILSDDNVNNLGFRILTEGIDLSQFKRNPIMYWMHARPSGKSKDEPLPIGYWENLRVENGVLLGDAVFDPDDEFAQKIEQKVKNKVIRMASPGLQPVEISDDEQYLKEGQTRATVVKSILKEVSIVDRGGNNSAVRLYAFDDKGIKLSEDASTIVPFLNKNNREMNLSEKSIKMLNLSDKSTDADIDAAITAIVEKANNAEKQLADKDAEIKKLSEAKEDLQKKLNDKKKADFEILLNDPKKKLTDEQKKVFLELFENAGEEIAVKTVKALPDYQSLKDVPDRKDNEDTIKLAEEWDKLHKEGKLIALKENDPERYELLRKAKFNK